VEARGDADVLAVLRSRTEGVRSLYAELAMAFEGGGESGVFDVVVHYRRPGWFRLTAFRDLVVSSRGIFDLVLTPERFALVIEEPDGPRTEAGPAAGLPAVNKGFRAFAYLREALFLPGAATEGEAAAVERREDGVLVRGRSPGGVDVVWRLEPATLGVESGEAPHPGEAAPIRIDYESYRAAGGVFLPERFTLEDPGAGISIRGVLEEVELDPALGDDVFVLEAAEAVEGGGR
jgi:hypothetical protein